MTAKDKASVAAATARLKAVDPTLTLLTLHYDVNLRLLCAAWPLLRPVCAFDSIPADPIVDLPHAWRSWLWEAAHVDRANLVGQIRQILGAAFPANLKLEQAAAGLLVFPDATVHPVVEAYLAHREGQIKRAVGMRKSGSESDGGEAPPEPPAPPPPEGGPGGLRVVKFPASQAREDAPSATQPEQGPDGRGGSPATRRRAARRVRQAARSRGES